MGLFFYTDTGSLTTEYNCTNFSKVTKKHGTIFKTMHLAFDL